jgi:hypothetical protein
MKCIQCGTDSKLKDRQASQGRCPRCRHPFAFEPTTMGAINITDPFFAKAIADISLDNTVFFTPQQLFYFLDKRKRTKAAKGAVLGVALGLLILLGMVGLFVVSVFKFPLPMYVTLGTMAFILYFTGGSTSDKTDDRTRRLNATALQILAVVILIVGGIWSASANSFVGYIVTAILAITSVWLGFLKKRQQANIVDDFLVTPSQAQGWFDRWTAINGVPPTLLSETLQILPSASVQSEVSAYSFDRLVVCDSPEIAHLLIRNNFHFEHNCAILSIDGYPQNIFDTTMEMLRRNPELKIYAIHDCTATGMQLIHKIRTQGWFPETDLPIIDVGISPRQAIAAKNLAIRQTKTSVQITPEVLQTLTSAEQKWLESGRYVELQSLAPQRLMQILTRAIATSQTTALDGGIDSGGAVIFIGDDSGMGFYGAESFG